MNRQPALPSARHLADCGQSAIWSPGATAGPAEVRDAAEDILRATAVDMQSDQNAAQQAEKSKGASRPWDESGGLTRASSSHGTGRMASGFDLWAVLAEYRAAIPTT
jgi:hypothetical protein